MQYEQYELFFKNREERLKELFKSKKDVEATLREAEEYKDSSNNLYSLLVRQLVDNANVSMKEINNQLKVLDDEFYDFYAKKLSSQIRSPEYTRYLIERHGKSEEEIIAIIRKHYADALSTLADKIRYNIFVDIRNSFDTNKN